MNGFERFNIKHLSPSSIACWRETPGLWCVKYLGKVWDEGGPAAQRGNAVERGLELILRGQSLAEAKAFASSEFLNLTLGDASDEGEKESALVPAMVEQAQLWTADMNVAGKKLELAATQLPVKAELAGVSVPVIGYVDFTFLGGEPDLDLKTTKACPSEPKPAHLRQIAFYAYARKRPAALLYVTGKKHAYYCPPPDVLDLAVEDMARTARSLERFLNQVSDPNEAILSLPHPVDSFYYGDASRAKVSELIGGA